MFTRINLIKQEPLNIQKTSSIKKETKLATSEELLNKIERLEIENIKAKEIIGNLTNCLKDTLKNIENEGEQNKIEFKRLNDELRANKLRIETDKDELNFKTTSSDEQNQEIYVGVSKNTE